ncbi:hypothetical protein GCM10010466_35410 [Planomonospora alba]|uniref:Uncharacterized protein n=1 Tax=Planomonospora alba TaxID=161354 RepID=A0ABP6NA84_9ACTN
MDDEAYLVDFRYDVAKLPDDPPLEAWSSSRVERMGLVSGRRCGPCSYPYPKSAAV